MNMQFIDGTKQGNRYLIEGSSSKNFTAIKGALFVYYYIII